MFEKEFPQPFLSRFDLFGRFEFFIFFVPALKGFSRQPVEVRVHHIALRHVADAIRQHGEFRGAKILANKRGTICRDGINSQSLHPHRDIGIVDRPAMELATGRAQPFDEVGVNNLIVGMRVDSISTQVLDRCQDFVHGRMPSTGLFVLFVPGQPECFDVRKLLLCRGDDVLIKGDDGYLIVGYLRVVQNVGQHRNNLVATFDFD